MAEQVRGILMIKSGSDYNELSEITISPSNINYVPQTSEKKYKKLKENPSFQEDLDKIYYPVKVNDDNVKADTPYVYSCKNLNKNFEGSYKITVVKRDINRDISPDQEAQLIVANYED